MTRSSDQDPRARAGESSGATPGTKRPVDPDAIERAKELLVYAPLGLALYLRDTAPSFTKLFVARGRSLLDRAATARAEPSRPDPVRPEPGLRVVPDHEPSPTSERDRDPEQPSGREPGTPATSERDRDLGIADYDDLSASEIVDRLEELPPTQLDIIRDYERAHRARSTVLGKIDQLTRPASA